MLIDILQKGLQGYDEDLRMEDTVHATILNRNDKKSKPGQKSKSSKNNKRAKNNIVLNKAISPLLTGNHDWLGSLEKVGQASQ